METYDRLKVEWRKKFDAMVTGLLLRGKSLSDAVKITEKAILRQIFRSSLGKEVTAS